jgi:eukaryotic-like serine/threonine-protein kinase
VPDAATWMFEEGEEIVEGRHAARLLGGGTRYEAWLAWDDRLFTFVVAKLLRPSYVDDVDSLAAMKRELAALERLRHPNLVRHLDACVDGPRPHLVLETVDGLRLSTLKRRYGVALEQVLPLALSVCSVIHYLAGERTLHLDVKPRNIVMSSTPKLIDLSIVHRFDELGALRAPVGTDAYMAPEQCDPRLFSELGPPADVFGLGATLYEMLSGAPPFPDAGRDGIYPQLTRDAPPLDPRRTPPVVAELVHACLDRRPENRPTPPELAREVEPLAATLPRPRLGRMRPGGVPRVPAEPSVRAFSPTA